MVKELEDYDWFPPLLRKQQVDFIGNIVKWFKIYGPLVPVLHQILQQKKISSIIDCCSGSGEPAVWIHRQLPGATQTLLTDKFPQALTTSTENIAYKKESSDMMHLQPAPGHLYTMYNAFHHFRAEEQQKILQQFADNHTHFLIAEILQPDAFTLLKIIFTTTIGQWLLAPFIRPFSAVRLFFTWLLPVNIITVTYDGIISVFKSKTAGQYSKLISGVGTKGYRITVSTLKSNSAKIVYITGTALHT
jgi:hypothetical protein